jgi:competence ComEA-like helix-hairpin-helix protein
MSIIKNITRLLSFTENEKRILILLAVGFMIGSGIAAYQGFRADLRVEDFSEQYRQQDSIFVERSGQIRDSDPEPAPPLTLLAPNSINVNTATKSELTLLPGIGDAYAERIILYREDYGPFTSPEELLNISGIGARRLEQIKPYITF